MSAPLFTKAVIGYRMWVLADQYLQPLGHYADKPWSGGENVAVCPLHAHHAPQQNCSCGLYAYHSLETTIDDWCCYNYFDVDGEDWMHGYIIGAVCGYQDVQLHFSGWRAEKARVVALLNNPRVSSLRREKLKEIYDVPLLSTPQQLKDEVRLWGETAPLTHRAALQPSLSANAYRLIANHYEDSWRVRLALSKHLELHLADLSEIWQLIQSGQLREQDCCL